MSGQSVVKQSTILVNLDRCIGCWSCAMACKMNNRLPDDVWWSTVRTLGNGEGIDRPNGIWPALSMSWMPVFTKDCVLCAGRIAQDKEPWCTSCCPTQALTFGDMADGSSIVSTKLNELSDKGFKIFRMPSWENSKENIIYATRR